MTPYTYRELRGDFKYLDAMPIESRIRAGYASQAHHKRWERQSAKGQAPHVHAWMDARWMGCPTCRTPGREAG